jgi:hypothetical protein
MRKTTIGIAVLATWLVTLGVTSQALAVDKRPPPRLVDNGDGTITDNLTGLMWEKKLSADGSQGGNCTADQASRSIHCVNNLYHWSSTGLGDPDGRLFIEFLARINANLSHSNDGATVDDVCFAGHCDWRAPNIAELRTIRLAPFPCPIHPCTDPIFGPTQQSFYWSSTTLAGDPFKAWGVSFHVFSNGSVLNLNKGAFSAARAVRGGR